MSSTGARPIAWGITGAGYLLVETFKAMSELRRKYRVKITTFLSQAGEEVVRVYGLWKKLHEISPGGYYEEVFTQKSMGASSTKVGRFTLRKYAVLVVSPASSNTVAKIVAGISDTLVTNAVAQAQKSGTPVIVVPTEREGTIRTSTPVYIDADTCRKCEKCLPFLSCKYSAIEKSDNNYSINLLKCSGCEECVELCDFNSIKRGEIIELKARKIDLENIEKLKNFSNTVVLKSPEEIEKALDQLSIISAVDVNSAQSRKVNNTN